MGEKDSLQTDNLISYNFYQLIESLAKKYNFELNGIDNCFIKDSLFIFESNPAINFPTSDIYKIEINDLENIPKIKMVVNFFGLHGSNGPLPGVVLNDIAYESHHQDIIKKTYLDFFNHHLIALLHSIWRKYKYYIQFKNDMSDNFSRALLSLIGISPANLENVNIDWSKLFFYIGLIQSNIRTAESLTKIVGHYFNLSNISIYEYERQLVNLDQTQRNSLGQKNMILGNNFIVGGVVTSFANKFKISILNLDPDNFQAFLPSGRKFSELKEIMKILLKDQLPYDLYLGLDPEYQSGFVLGNNDSSFLGWSTLLSTTSIGQAKVSPVIITAQV